MFKGCLELALQEHYTELPGDGQTHMTIYNGLPPSCRENLNLIQLNYIPDDPQSASQTFNFTNFENLYSEKMGIANEGNFSINAFDFNCSGEVISFESITFPAKIELDDDHKNEVPNIYVLVTYDLDDLSKGILNINQNFNGPIDKTANGKPDLK